MQPTYKRQRFLLAFIRQLQGDVTFTDLQKLVFLYSMEENVDFYEFIPYKFGSYSFQLAEDMDILRRDGHLCIESTRIKAANEYQKETSFRVTTERGDKLIRKVYRTYPYYAINSEIICRLFHGAERERFQNEKQKYTKIDQVLFTIGYEGKSVEAFMNTLIQNDIRLLCDVRKNPLSRKFGFSKGKLEHITKTIGIKYAHMPDLGIESNKRRSLETVEDYRCLFDDYSKKLLCIKPQLDRIFSLLCSDTRIALMCYEREPEMCHRHVIRDYMASAHQIRSEDL